MSDLQALKQWASPRQCEIIDAVTAYGTQRKAAEALGINLCNVERALKRARKNASKHGWSPDHDMVYPAPDTHLVKGVSTLYGPTGMVKQQWVRTDLKKEALHDALIEASTELCSTLPRYEPRNDELLLTTDALSAYVIGDAHIGALVQDHQNLNQGKWDLNTAETATLEAINYLIGVSGGADIGMLVDVGDFAHADNSANVSQSGHFHKTDGDFKDVITACMRIYRQAIEMMLGAHREVVVMIVRGNHNKDSSLFMSAMLEAVYDNEPRVNILCNRHKFMHYEYGNNFFGSHHGDRMKIDQAYQFFTRTFSESWGRTKHRHCFMGHIHHQTAKEHGGMFFESYNTIASTDEWHSHSGYGSKRSMTSIIFDKDHGEVQRHKVNINQIEEMV